MTSRVNYSYTPDDVDRAFNEIAEQLFDKTRDIDQSTNPTPKALIVAGVQGSGKTYLLENTLLKDPKYSNYVRLYLPEYRKKHPQYADMEGIGVLHAYQHTEQFTWALGAKIFQYAFANKYNFIMETALDSIDFAAFPMTAANDGYQFEVHLIGCKKEFAYLSTISRALKSLKDKALERFVDLSAIEASMANAQSILTAFESACLLVPGSEIIMYERGFGVLKDRTVVCHSRCDAPEQLTPQPINTRDGQVISPAENTVRIERTPILNVPCTYNNYATIVNAQIFTRDERGETLKECHLALSQVAEFAKHIPYAVYSDLYAYIVKYVFR
ncbi:zeta toxin family protein [Pseudomonas sp. CCI3.2]|uniref:zeta toxin family protein n=1 Tax=unclassified Pseudomonas TaxID=196821 RepID=UPI002AC99D85|nr:MULTISPECIES: zeta toxin family protein [unclassified Pseudomonas]MEB0078131.1 zeta toxin family protein [Pseudomonas sp. MH10out]MEB0102185.1 zeta toxin family protein [Pseudomonas sp. CCI3.2]MEB0158976.1 zeta toxin family protein [Pseudomonas sp. AH2 (2023)]MEB0170359.1 zeta toxin family protein [Pseudomonas sp. CCC4.4]WPX29372.1 zeta toxin family protein [Pseudomonas sp. AH2]